MKLTSLFCSAVFALLFASCADTTHLITDTHEREQMESDFRAKCSYVNNDSLFSIFSKKMTPLQKEALSFLYAYMSLGDIADYSGEFFLENVDYSLKAKKEMPWGNQIPEREFRHFVLPIRVNNENLDNSRKVFYNELKDRVKNLSLYDAVLEVNHWCHEKVVYTPSDARTSSPLASVKTAYGRCGEESTFTVAALRSVGIPARQVYTPRWAHSDDNHAWVEAWVDGKWYFMGACEPEPVLNLGWFNAPASRGMLMHTKAFGRYNGSEEKMSENSNYTEINVTNNYAPVAKAIIKIKNRCGAPVKGAIVDFKVYNYAEFYTVVSKISDENGEASLSAGLGDMLVWVSKDGKLGYEKVSFGKDSIVNIVLDKDVNFAGSDCFDIIPPVERFNMPEVTSEQRAENSLRMAKEDSIRNKYVASFIDNNEIKEFSDEFGYDVNVVSPLFKASRGNYGVIKSFLSSLNSDDKNRGIALLKSISAKDLRDVTLEVLIDNIKNTSPSEDKIHVKFVLSPRVSNEMLMPYKEFFNNVLTDDLKEKFTADNDELIKWVGNNIQIDNSCNLGGAPISPIGVWKTRKADQHSRNIFFVSLARTLGIASRVDDVTGKLQIHKEGIFHDVTFDEKSNIMLKGEGVLKANYIPIKSLKDPKYYSHFTISKIDEHGRLNLLNYDEGDIDMGPGTTWSNLLKNGTKLDEGEYVMVAGTRLVSGSVLSDMTFFSIKPNKETTVDLKMRESKDGVEVIGNFNSESLYKSIERNETKSILSTTGRGYYVVAVLGANQEPTNHAMRDLVAMSNELETWGRKIIILFPSFDDYKKFNKNEFGKLPSTIEYGIDIDSSIQKQIAEGMKLSNKNVLPMFIIGDTFNRVVFVSQGYAIGLGEKLMKTIHKL